VYEKIACALSLWQVEQAFLGLYLWVSG
jgi:hypothetical protein